MQDPRASFQRVMVDWLLMAAVAALLLLILLSIASNPDSWRLCLDILDLRNWNHWAWTGVATTLLGALLLIRVWPEKKR